MAGRPKGSTKYKTDQQRKAARKRSIAPQIKGKYFRLVIPDLTDFTNDPEALLALKGDTLNLLLQRQSDLQYHKIAVQIHPTTGVPHLDILLLYKKSVRKSLNRFDYLIKHGNLTRYKKLNQAILSYGDKQDKKALTNMPKQLGLLLRAKVLQSDPYFLLEQQMLKDPFHFDAHQWLASNNLTAVISRTNWPKAISLIKHRQQVQCNRRLHDKAGFKLISRALIEQQLTSAQLALYDSWSGYQTIVDKLNQVVIHKGDRPHKTKQLLIVGSPNTGKTSLALRIQKHTSVYYMGVHHWFPAYRSGVYPMILWNQFHLRPMSYPQLLNFLQGTKMDLQYKGGSTLKTDNQLIFMTSNMTLSQHIAQRFRSDHSRDLAEANLRARIQQVILPPGCDLFLLQKLIVDN